MNTETSDRGDISEKFDQKEDDIIQEHILEMEKETTNWTAYQRKTKSKFQELEKFKNDVNVISWAHCKNDLSQEDMDFLFARPDYRGIVKKLDEMDAKIHILQLSNYKMKITSQNNVTKVSRSVHQIKQDLCEYLLTYDESELLASRIQ